MSFNNLFLKIFGETKTGNAYGKGKRGRRERRGGGRRENWTMTCPELPREAELEKESFRLTISTEGEASISQRLRER
jgi:hypothetical protein